MKNAGEETWLSKERFLLNSTPRFLTDNEETTEQPPSVRQHSRLLLVGVLGPILYTSVFFQNLAVRNYFSSIFSINYAFHKSSVQGEGNSIVCGTVCCDI